MFSDQGLTAVSVAAAPLPYPPRPRVFQPLPPLHQLICPLFAQLLCPTPHPPADIAQRYRISKYPTLKLFRNGMMMKREYRGQRSVVAIADFIRQQQVDPVKELHSLEEVQTLDVSLE